MKDSDFGIFAWQRLLLKSAWLMLCLFAVASQVQAEDNGDLLWVAQNNAVFGFSKTDNSIVVDIPNLQPTVREVVPDIERDRLWVFSDQGLLAFNLAGEFQQITPFSTPDANTARLELNPNDGYVWLTAGRRLFIFNNEGIEKYSFTFQQTVSGISVDVINDRVWVSGNRNIVALAIVDGDLTEVDRIRSGRRVFDIAVNPATGVLWVGANNRLRRYPDNTGFDLNFVIADIIRLRVAENGQVFLVTDDSLIGVFAEGPIAFNILPFFGRTGIQDLIIDEATESVWASRNRRLRQFDFEGNRLENIRLPRAVRDLAVAQDRNAPEIEFVVPQEADFIPVDELLIELNVLQGADSLNQESIVVTLNGENLAVDCEFIEANISCTPVDTSSLVEGPAELAATIEDDAGNISNTAQVIITLGEEIGPLTINLVTPSDGAIVSIADITIEGSLSRAASLSLNGEVLALDAEFNFSQVVTLEEGNNSFTLLADDGNEQTSLDFSVILDTSLPSITFIAPENGLITNQPLLTIIGSTTDTNTLTFDDTPVTLTTEGGFTIADVNLVEGQNSFNFIATDANGNTVTEIFNVTLDTIAPTITITSPVDGSITGAATQTISGNLSEAAELSLNGSPIAIDQDNSFTLEDTPLQEGENSFSFVAIDAAGNQTELSLIVTRDSQAPVITLTAPQNNSVTNQSEISITGNVEGADQLSINGESVSLADNGDFNQGPFNLVEGDNSFTLIATDSVGNTAELVLTITLDSITPVITITSPIDGSITQDDNVDVIGSLSETANLTLNGNAVTLADDNSYSLLATPLSEGENVFVFIATDAAGNQAERSMTIIRDSAAPIITIATPQNNSITNQTELTITGSVDDASVVTLDGNPITLDQNGNFSEGPITLNEGLNTFTFNAQDAAGNSSELVLTITLDSITPVITITSPQDGSFTSTESTNISGSLSEAATLTLNANVITLNPDNSFTQNDVALVEGVNTFTFVATDAAGNSAETIITVTRDSQAPVITITTPQDGTVTNQEQIVIQGSADGATVLSLDGVTLSLAADGSFSSGNIALNEGENSFNLVAADEAGNTAELSLTITRDSITPLITLTEPVDGLITNAEEQAFSGSVSEAANLSFNGIDIPLAADNSFTIAPIPLNNGANVFNFVATDAAGNSSQLSVTVTRDMAGPVVTISSPANNTLTNNDSIVVTGTVSELASLTINNNPVALNPDLSFNANISLVEGVNVITVLAVDSAGNAGQALLTITRDSVAPNTPVASLINRSNAQNGIISLQGNAGSVDADISVSISNSRTAETVTVIANADGSFSAQIAGENDDVLSIITIDSAGNESNAVNINPPAPANLTLMPIGDQTATLGRSLTFNVIALDSEDSAITLGISPLPLPDGMSFNNSSGEFSYTPTLAQVGSFELTFMAMTDDEALEETVTFTVPQPDGNTRVTGTVLTTNRAPLAGVRLEIDNQETFSGVDGIFTFSDLNVSGSARLLVDGSTVDRNLGVFATVPENINVIAGADNQIPAPVVLLPLDIESSDQVVPTQTSIITSRAETGIDGELLEPVVMTIPPNAARMEDGSQFVGEITITRVEDPNDGPQPLPEDIGLSYYISVQPFGVVYPEPVPISFPNIENFPPGSMVDVFALNSQSGQFEKVGEALVSNNGRTVDSIGGVVESNSWHGFSPAPNSNNNMQPMGKGDPKQDDPKQCDACKISLESGNLGEDHKLPSYYSLGTSRTVNLSYNSELANPRPIVRFDSNFGNLAPPPDAMSTQISVAGIVQGAPVFSEINMTPSTTTFSQFEDTRLATQINGVMFESGVYNYEIEVDCFFPISRRMSRATGTVVVQNESNSFFGAGWTLNGLQRLYENPEGVILISEGDGTGLEFSPPENATPTGEQVYESPTADFSTLRRLADGSFSRRMKDGMVYNFDASGLQATMLDRNGNITQYVYNNDGSLSRIIDPTNREYIFTYVGNRIRTISDPLNRTTTFEHDAEGNLVKIIEPNGDEREFEYDANHLLTAQEDQRDNRKQYSYNAQGRIIGALLADGSTIGVTPSATTAVIDSADGTGANRFNLAPPPALSSEVNNFYVDQNGNLSSSQTDPNGAPTMEEDAVGRITEFERDEDSLPMATTRPNTSRITRTFDILGNPTLVREEFNGAEYRYTYDDNSLVTQFINPRGNTTNITRDLSGNATLIVNQLGHTTEMEYDTRGLVTRSVSPNNLVTTYTYNDQGLVATMTETPPVGSPGNIRVTRYSYDAAGQMTQTITPDLITLDMVYDSKGRLTSVTDNLNQRIEYIYDPYNNLVKTDTSSGDNSLALRVEQAFDVRNRLVEIRSPQNDVEDSVIQRLLDNNSNLVGMIDPNGNPSSNEYDGEDRLIGNTHRLNGITEYTYDTNDRIIRVMAPNGVVTNYTYDLIARRTSESSPDRGTITYEYDLANNLTQMVDARGIVINMTYDQLERVETKTFPNTIAGKIEDVTYVYDNCDFGLGYLCSRNDESGSYSYDYDVFGNVVSMSFTEIAGVEYTMGYVYDDGDNMIQSIYPSGRVVNYGRDGVRRINQIQTSVGGQSINLVDNITYRGDNQMLTCDYGNGLSDTRTYDLQGRLVSQQLTGSVGIIDSRNYSYDFNSNITNIDTNLEDNFYTYDPLDRIIEDTINANSPIRFDYDLNNNRLTSQTDDLLNISQISHVPGSNRIASNDELTNGLAPNYNSRQLVFNDANRLYQLIEDGVLKAEYIYNDEGQRTRKTVFQADGVTVDTVTVYHYDYMGYLIEETTETGALIKDYIWQEGMYPVAQIDNTQGIEQVLYLYNDHLMTNRLATDESQNIIWRWEGEAFGNTQAQELAGFDINLRFPGQYFDSETNLHYNHFRYYDTQLGRYITSDPIGLDGGKNTYSYASQNSLSRVDILGLKDCCSGKSCCKTKGDESAFVACIKSVFSRFEACTKIAIKANRLCALACAFIGRVNSGAGAACDTACSGTFIEAKSICRRDAMKNFDKCVDDFLCLD